jgi:hypothetical protein
LLAPKACDRPARLVTVAGRNGMVARAAAQR